MVVREEFYVDSMDRVHMIHGYRWYDPEQEWIGVLQIIHGMLEYIERYDEFAEKMAEAGYYVIGHDHLGHGDSVNSMEELGHLGEDGAVLWLKDMELVRRMAVAAAPNLPYIMLGHSMGSFLVRRYLIYHGERVDGAVLIGTGQQPFLVVKLGLLTVWAGKLLKGGREGKSRLLNRLTVSGYAKKYPDNARTGSWMSRDPQVLIQVLRDEKMNFQFTRGAYEALFRTVEEDINRRRAAKMPKDLPLLILSGEEDPVGGYGKGVRRFEAMLSKTGMQNVTCRIYPGARHELLNDYNKEEVTAEILAWCNEICSRGKRRNAGG